MMMVSDELAVIWKEAVVALLYHPGTRLRELRKDAKK
jgi:hypothetical protein